MYMGWAQERASPGRHSQAWKPKFVALKGPDVFLFEFPPVSMLSYPCQNYRLGYIEIIYIEKIANLYQLLLAK